MMGKTVIFDWGGVIMHKAPVPNNDKEAIIRCIKSFNPSLTDEAAWDVYAKTLRDEKGEIISKQNDNESRIKWVNRIIKMGGLNATYQDFVSKFVEEYLKVEYYKDLVSYITSLKGRCKVALFSDLIFCCTPALDKQVDLGSFDYVFLSYISGLRKDTEDAFINVERRTGSLPNEILFIDDTTPNIENAKKRGWNTCQAFGYELDKIKQSVEAFLQREEKIGEPSIK